MSIILIGKNSKLFKDFEVDFKTVVDFAISHKDIEGYKFKSNYDSIILLSYSRRKEEQEALINKIKKINVKNLILVSSCACLVAEQTNCYSYPNAKLYQEKIIRQKIPKAKILRLGTVVSEENEHLYKGILVAEIANVIRIINKILKNPPKLNILYCYKLIEFNNKKTVEYLIYKIYCFIISRLSFPCILRPVDLMIKFLFGYKWYGYGILSVIIQNKAFKFDEKNL